MVRSARILPILLLPFLLASRPQPQDPFRTLRPGHPRLIILEDDVRRARALAGADPTAREYLQHIREDGERILKQSPVEYKLIGPRLLDKSRRCLDRIYTLAALYRVDGDRKWLERAKQELFACAAFPDWHPVHFLDTAEMTHAFAIGYDWLYPALTTDERALLRKAIVEKGLTPGRQAYEGKAPWRFWVTASHNWNNVCNGGMILGALAVADEEPEMAAYILQAALKSLPRAMASFAPDGGWNEGPGYWSYTVRYTVPLLAGLETALGTDFGISGAPGFDRAGAFRIFFDGPLHRSFNYADAGDGVDESPWMHWLGRRFHQPLYHWEARQSAGRGSPLDLFWFDAAGAGPRAARVPLDTLFRGIDVAFFRSAWEDREALFVGFKGGDNRANHAHLDLGTFVLDALGERWALDLGGDDYNMPGYFGRQRWSYYRLGTPGHNTVILDGANQDPRARAPIIAFSSTGEGAYAVADLTPAYAPKASRVWRGLRLVDRRQAVLIEDEVEATEPVAYRWAMHTRAQITLDGRSATLAQAGKTLYARILEPAEAVFASEDAAAPEPQNPNRGVRRLEVRLPAGRTTRVTVLLTTRRASEAAAIRPLADWVSQAPSLPALGGELRPARR